MSEEKSSRVVLRNEMIFTGYSSNGYSIPLDASPRHGGHGAGIRPIELMLTSLAGCTGMDIISILRKKQQRITAFEVQVEGARAAEHPRVFTDITVRVVVTGHNVDPAAVDRAIALSREKYCPAAATLRHTATITYLREIIEAGEPDEA
jgi:putative redox protein